MSVAAEGRRGAPAHVVSRPGAGRPAPALALLLAAVLAVLAGCASLPRSGPVQRGDPDVTEPGSIALLARLPSPNDTPEQIVDGFLRASAAGLTDDFTIAREFLAGALRSSWDPLAQVEVYDGLATLATDAATSTIEVRGPAFASIDGAGRYSEALPGTTVTATFGLSQDGQGRWRITALADGLLLSEPIFRSLFQQAPLYFADPAGTALVSETRWYPRRTVETSAVSSLLEGPSPWLAEGATSRFPPGTRLLVDTVTVRDGVAQVGLSAEARDASPADRTLMMAQLTETLAGLPRVQSVEVTVSGAPFDAAPFPGELVVDPSVGTTPAVLSGDAVKGVEGSELVQWGQTGPVTVPSPSDPAVPYGRGRPVVLSGGIALATAPEEGARSSVLLEGGDRLTGPSFDRHGWVWCAAAAGGPVHAVRVDGTRVTVKADWLAGREVRSLRISREGARALVVSLAGSGVLVEVAAVVRDADGVPVGLGTPLRIGQQITAAGRAVWVDQQTVAVLGRLGDSSAETVVLSVVGGPTSALPAVGGAVDLAAGKGDRLLFVATSSGELFARNGLGWAPVVRGVRDPAFPG